MCSNIFDDNRVDDEDVDDVDYSESMHWCNFEPVHHLHHHLINNKVCFNLFDVKKQDFLSGDDLGDIMRCDIDSLSKTLDLICRAMGFRPTDEELKDLLEEVKITNLPID